MSFLFEDILCYNFLSFQAGGFCFEPGVLDAVRNEDATYIIPRTVSSLQRSDFLNIAFLVYKGERFQDYSRFQYFEADFPNFQYTGILNKADYISASQIFSG